MMGLNVQHVSHIPTEETRDIVLPFFYEWFGLDAGSNILEDVEVIRAASGGGLVSISLGMFVDSEKLGALESALAAKGLKL